MKLEDFKTLKKEIEISKRPINEGVEDSMRIYAWMEKTGRLDEGVWGSIWSWLKRNFSITSRRIHALADEYGKELMEEGRAEFLKTKNPKDLSAKFRAGSYNRLSRDIEDRMEIIAGDDEDYRGLVRALVNKKNLEVKKALLEELAGKFDPDDFSSFTTEVDSDLKDADLEYDRKVKNLASDKRDLYNKILDFMEKKMVAQSAMFSEAMIRTSAERKEFVKLLFTYVNALSEKMKGVELDSKTVYSIAKQYAALVKELSKKIESSRIDKKTAIEMVKAAIDKLLKESKPLPFEKLKPEVTKAVQRKASETPESPEAGPSSPEEVVTTAHSEEVIGKAGVKDGIETAAEETGKSSPTPKDITTEINDFLKTYLEKNITVFTEKLNRRIDKFNNLPDDQKKTMAEEDYEIDPKNFIDKKLTKVTPALVASLFGNFVDVAGAVVPYFQRKSEDDAKVCAKTVLDFMFEIYIVKKDSGKITTEEMKKIVNNVKKRYPEDFK